MISVKGYSSIGEVSEVQAAEDMPLAAHGVVCADFDALLAAGAKAAVEARVRNAERTADLHSPGDVYPSAYDCQELTIDADHQVRRECVPEEYPSTYEPRMIILVIAARSLQSAVPVLVSACDIGREHGIL